MVPVKLNYDLLSDENASTGSIVAETVTHEEIMAKGVKHINMMLICTVRGLFTHYTKAI